ncbi:AP2/ERF domain-containing protein [Artemisia annua]|uniref:AP2/ERF domain-containing protein n=1 Tax=Artemisia annua TaxID=35608 RepID=A0A2U1M027_ARTAN|nr:AP2/ERF domain-containing protein [Artemisia annua]
MDPSYYYNPMPSFSQPEYYSNHHFLPFNENDSQDMLLYGVIADSDGQTQYCPAEPDIAYESLKDMGYMYEEGTSPVLALKRMHSIKRKNEMKSKKREDTKDENVVVFEDLGSDYLEQLLGVDDEVTEPKKSQ